MKTQLAGIALAGPGGVTADEILADLAAHLGAAKVRFCREAGFDPENLDWYWAKYLPDGSLDVNAAGMVLDGRVARGMDEVASPVIRARVVMTSRSPRTTFHGVCSAARNGETLR